VKTTIALPDELYTTVKHWASTDGTSINLWMQQAVEREVFRRRCVAHGQWLAANPGIQDELLAQHEAAAREIEDLQRGGNA
jgi:predicted transcriptional regulator